MKKLFAFALILALSLTCVSALAEVVGGEGYTVKTGLSYSDQWGATVANVIEKDGEVVKVLFDTVRDGVSSKEKYDDYGIKKVSTIGKEWWEQVAFMENWVEQNGLDSLEVTEDGYAANPDVLTGATIHVSYYAEALANAEAGVTEMEGYSVKTGFSYSDQWGLTVANVIEKDGEVVKVLFDTVRDGQSSKEKFDTYGIKKVSTIGKEWWEQVAFVENWVEQNGLDSLEVTEDGHAANPDVLTGATINVSYYAEALADALSR